MSAPNVDSNPDTENTESSVKDLIDGCQESINTLRSSIQDVTQVLHNDDDDMNNIMRNIIKRESIFTNVDSVPREAVKVIKIIHNDEIEEI